MPYRALLDLIDSAGDKLAAMRAKIRRGELVTVHDVADVETEVNRMGQLVERTDGSTPTGVMPQIERPDGDDGSGDR